MYQYGLNLLYKFGMVECKSVATPLDRNLKLDANSGTTECGPAHYRQLVRSLIYLMITRPDLSYHLDCAKRVLQFVSGTIDCNILYKLATLIRHEGYADVDWAGYRANRRLTSGFIFSLESGAISWRNMKQLTVAISRTKAEYKCATVTAFEAVWLMCLHQRPNPDLLRQS